MHTLVLDIETVGEKWEEIDGITKESLLRWVKRSAKNDLEKSDLENGVKESLGLSPFTGMVVAIGLYDVEREQGIVYYQGGDEKEFEEGGYTYRSRSEKEMLEDFWEGAKEYDTFVTFSGRRFDVPFLMLRSVANEVVPTKELMQGRYLYQQKSVNHVDLQDQLTFYGAVSKKPSLHLCTRAFGIESPKSAGIDGGDVAKLFRMKKFRDIAMYNSRDVVATTELYKKWLTYLAPQSFKHRFEEIID